MNRTLIGFCSLLALTACGGGGEAPPKPKPTTTSSSTSTSTEAPKTTEAAPAETAAPAAGGKQDWNASMGTATVSGKVAFEGDAPAMAVIDMSSDPKCQTDGTTEESVVVNGGGLANCIISVSGGLDGYEFADGEGKVSVDQKGCKYLPHVVAMQAGQTISISNSDDTVHNVHSYSKRNQAFNQAQPAGAAAIEKEMGRKDKMFPVKCDMHSWMSCYVAVFDHPFFTVSDAEGNFTLPKLPAGTYELTAEHETLGKKTVSVTVADGGTATASFSFSK
jgi:plastocyanin